MNPDILDDDCQNCAALCCVALAFDMSDLFAFDKVAGTPCRNLTPDGACGIHAAKDSAGFNGCTAYTCLGAGQRVVQECFEGQSWQSNPDLLAPMLAAFQSTRKLHEMLSLLGSAQKLPLGEPELAEWNALMAELTPKAGLTLGWLTAIAKSDVETRLHRFLRSLQALVKGI